MIVPSLYEIYAIVLFVILASLLLCSPLVAATWCVLHRVMHKVQFRRLVRRHALVGPFYTCKVFAFAIILALNVAVLSLETTRTQATTLSLRLTKLSDAAGRAKYLALLNLTVVYISPHHYGVADALGLSLRLYQQAHRVAGLLSLCLILFSSIVTLAGDPHGAMTTDEGRSGLMVCAPKRRRQAARALSYSVDDWLYGYSRGGIAGQTVRIRDFSEITRNRCSAVCVLAPAPVSRGFELRQAAFVHLRRRCGSPERLLHV